MNYRRELDGMRAVAIGMVAMFHAHKSVFHGGWIGVDVFFVLSGYLITNGLLSELAEHSHISLPNFYARRFLRLVPALTVLLAVVIAVEVFSNRDFWPVIMAGSYLMNWNRAFEWGSVGVLGHTWSLAIEEQFYLLWPPLLMLMGRASRLKWTLALLAAGICWKLYLVASGADVMRIYNGFDTHADGLLIGCALAQVQLSPMVKLRLERLWYVPASILGAMCLWLSYDSLLATLLAFPLVGVLTAWLVVACEKEGVLKSLLSVGVAVFIGRISYGVYLWHDPLLIYFRGYLPKEMATLLIVAAVMVAAASYYLVERPFLRLKKHLPDLIARRRPVRLARAD